MATKASLACLGFGAAAAAYMRVRLPSLPVPSGHYKHFRIHRMRIPGGPAVQLTVPLAVENGPAPLALEHSGFDPNWLQWLGFGTISSAASGKVIDYFRISSVDGLAAWLKLPRWLGRLVLAGRSHVDHIGEIPKNLPVVIFSHGIGGSMELYTQLCRELASVGAVVVAIEHEDGSASFAETESGSTVAFERPPQGMKYSRSEVIRFRAPFLQHRLQEVSAVLSYLNATSQSDAPEALRYADTSKVLISGHSLGASTSIIASASLPDAFAGVVLFDVWPYPLSDAVLSTTLLKSVLCLSSHQFAQSPEFALTRRWLDHQDDSRTRAFMVRGTRHRWVSDASWWLPWSFSAAAQHRATMHVALSAVDHMLHATGRPFQVADQMASDIPETILIKAL